MDSLKSITLTLSIRFTESAYMIEFAFLHTLPHNDIFTFYQYFLFNGLKMRCLYLTFAFFLFLTGCQSTNYQEYPSTRSNKDYEQHINEITALMSEKVASGKLDEIYKLATIYTLSVGPIKRAKAKPILEELVAEGNAKAIHFFASHQFLGTFGYVSDVELEKYHDEINSYDSDVIKEFDEEKKQWQDIIETNFNEFEEIYKKTKASVNSPLKV
jgi:hypothetical protein